MPLNHSYYIVDVFTDKAFNGAQLAVFPDAETLDDTQMQLIAREINLAETVFITTGAEKSFRLRSFAPTLERHFSGHAIIAAGYVLGKYGHVDTDSTHNQLLIEQNTGSTSVVISRTIDADLFIQFSLKAHPVVDRYVPANKELASALSLNEIDIGSARYHTLLVSCEQPYLIVPLRTFECVRRAVFNLKEWSSAVAPVSAANEILLFSTRSDLMSSNFHGRLVGPQISIEADPPIGSSMPAFAGYLSAHEHVRQGTYSFVIDRGTLSTRKSVLTVEMVNQPGKENEIRVGGPAVVVGEGTISTP